jgi:diguanylate cyclase (GGDEF)-like protein
LPGVLLVVASVAFTTSLVAFSGEISPAWLLYLVPITIGALTYDVPGGLAAVVLSLGACLIAAPQALAPNVWPELATGFGVFTGCGVVVGVQAHRQRSHATALEEASALDRVAGVLKPAAFAERLDAEVRRAERYHTPLGLVLVRVRDLEGFERLFGHYKTDLMLQHLASVVALAARSTDLVGRLDEATLALAAPGADAEGARRMAERVGAACAAARFEGDALEPAARCDTVTAWASFPASAASAEALVEAAREALEATRLHDAGLGGGSEAER